MVERQKTVLPTDPNCCPSGPVKTRFVRWTGASFEYAGRRPPDEDVPDPPPDGAPGPPPPSGEPGCEAAVQAGPLELRASCFRRQEDGTYKATGQVRINGIDLVPAKGDAEVVFDPESLELRASGTVQLQVGPVVLYEGSFNRNLGVSFTLRVPKGSSLKGFPVTGEAKVTLRGNGAEIAANVSIEALGGVSGGATLTATTTEGLRLDALNLKVGQARVGPIPMRDVSLGYTRTPEGDRWEGGATIELPGPKLASLSGFAAFVNGGFVEGRGELTGSFPVFPGILITRVSAGLVLEPEFGFSGGMALSAGPRVLGVTAASVDGTFTYQDGSPALFRLNGDITLVKVKLAGGELAYRTNGQVTMRGNLDLTLGGVGFQGDLAGFVDGLRAFSAEGSGTVGFKGTGLGGEGVVSSVGAAACGKGPFGLRAGFGVRWESFPQPTIMAPSCGIGETGAWPGPRAGEPGGRQDVPGPARDTAAHAVRCGRGRAAGRDAARSGRRRAHGAGDRSHARGRAARVPQRGRRHHLSRRRAAPPRAVDPHAGPRLGAGAELPPRRGARPGASARPGDRPRGHPPAALEGLPPPRSARELLRAQRRGRAPNRGHPRRPRLGALPPGRDEPAPAAHHRADRARRAAGGPTRGRPLPSRQQAPGAPRTSADPPPPGRRDRALQPVAPSGPPRGPGADLGRPDAALPAAPPAHHQGGRSGAAATG